MHRESGPGQSMAAVPPARNARLDDGAHLAPNIRVRHITIYARITDRTFLK